MTIFGLHISVYIKGNLVPNQPRCTSRHCPPYIHQMNGKKTPETKMWTNYMLLRYMSLEVKGLPLSTYGLCSSGTSSQLKSSSAGAIWMCKAFFTGSSCPLPCIWFRSLPNRQWLGWWFSHTCSICWIWSTVRSSIWSPLCIIGHSSRNRMHGDTRLFTCGNVSLTLERIVMSQAWRLERNWRSTTTTVTRES